MCEIYSVSGDKAKGLKWLQKAVVCRKEILDPKVKETEGKLKIKDYNVKIKIVVSQLDSFLFFWSS